MMSDKPFSDPVDATLAMIADGFRLGQRAPLWRTPAAVGLAFEDVTIASDDGVPLEAWYVPCRGSNRLVIVNHPKGFSRSGLPSHLEPWRSQLASSGNDVEVDFTADLRLLHDAGYAVLAYDLRNHGHSGAANGGIGTSGRFESRDVLGTLAYAERRWPEAQVSLFARCLGANAALIAAADAPERVANVRCLIAAQPLSPGMFLAKQLSLIDIAPERLADLDDHIRRITSYTLAELSPIDAAAKVHLPTLMYQVRDDLMTDPSDVQAIFDAVPAEDKELFWIEDTTVRWHGYTHFQLHPERVLAWLDLHHSAK